MSEFCPGRVKETLKLVIKLRKAVGMAFQQPNPLPFLTYEKVVFGLHIHHRRGELNRARLDAAVEQALR